MHRTGMQQLRESLILTVLPLALADSALLFVGKPFQLDLILPITTR